MKTKILIVEHDSTDIDLIQHELGKGDIDYEALIVETSETYETALRSFQPDVILSDYSLPAFSGPVAFKIREKIAPNIPFIFVSGTIGEENSIELIKNGVTDFAVKDKLFTLNIKIKRALRESKDAQEKLLAEIELVKNEKRLNRAQQVAHIGSWQTNLSNYEVIWSDEVFRIFGLDQKTFKPTHAAFLSIVHPEDRDIVDEAFLNSVEKRTINNIVDHRIVTAKGEVKHLEERWEIVYDEAGNAVLAEGTCQDITQKKLAQESIRQSEARLKEAQKLARIGNWEIDMTTTKEHIWSDEMFHTFGIEPIPASTELFLSFIHPDDAEFAARKTQEAFETLTDSSFEFRFVRKNGSPGFGYSEWKFEFDKNRKPVRLYGIVQDITEKKQAEQALKESEEFSKGVLASLSSHIAVIDTKGNVIAVNRAWENFAKENGITVLERVGNGTNYFNVCQTAVQQGDDIAQEALLGIQEVINGEKSFFEMRYPCHSPAEERWFMMRVVNFKNVKGRLVVAHEDITKTVKAEHAILALNESLEQKVNERTAQLTEANKALEAFSYSVSHDLKSPVRSIIGFANIIQKQYGESFSPDLKELFTHIESSSKRMKAIIDDLLILAKFGKEKLNHSTINMNSLVDKVWGNISLTMPHRATLNTGLLPEVQGDESMLEQVMVNLLANAVKYSSKKEAPLVEVGFENHQGTVTFFVKDNGAGFDMKHYNRMFGAFQRLHDMSEFEGTGIGLLLVKQIIERHAGAVWAEGKLGEGATFYFSLPAKI